MYFSVPVRSGVTITDTPIEARSIRSFYFVDRTGKSKFYQNGPNDNGRIRCRASIYIDGKAICENLFILPFMDTQQTLYEGEYYDSYYSDSYDYRKISIPCLKNVNLSEIKIEADEDCNMDFEVVFECSDVAVEQERFTNIESFVVSTSSTMFGDYNLSSLGDLTLETKREADRFFFYQFYLKREDEYVKNITETFSGLEFTWKGETEETPERTPINLMSCGYGTSWKDAVYYLSIPFTKHPQMYIDHTLYAEYADAFVVFLAHEDNF